MSETRNPIFWYQGLFLQPQHFQQAERYAEGLLEPLRDGISPFFHGVRQLQLQEAAVQKVAAAAAALGRKVSPAFPSPLKGPKGNQEYFLQVIRPEAAPDSLDKPHA